MTREDKRDIERLGEIVDEVIDACGGPSDIDVSPAWVATQAFININPGLSIRRDWPLAYVGCHLQLRQIARHKLAKKFGPAGDDDEEDELFPELQQRYPVKRDNPEDEPVYRRLEMMSYSDIQYNVARLRSEARAKMKHAQALEDWWKKRKRGREA